MKKLKEKIRNKLGKKRTADLKKALRIGRIIKNVVCWTLIAVLTIAIVIFMTTKISGGTPSIFGYTVHRISSGSMEPELSVGDVIICKQVKEPSELSVRDIITFNGGSRFDYQKITHRVLVAPYDDSTGKKVLVTKGDANEDDDGVISFSDVESKYLTKVNFLRDVYNFFFSTWGLLIFIFLLLLIFFDEIVNIVRLSIGAAEEDDAESFREIVERVKREQLEEAKKNADEEAGELNSDSVVKEVANEPQPMDVKAKKQSKNEKAKAKVKARKKQQSRGSDRKKGSAKNKAGNEKNKTGKKSASSKKATKRKSKKKSKKRKKR